MTLQHLLVVPHHLQTLTMKLCSLPLTSLSSLTIDRSAELCLLALVFLRSSHKSPCGRQVTPPPRTAGSPSSAAPHRRGKLTLGPPSSASATSCFRTATAVCNSRRVCVKDLLQIKHPLYHSSPAQGGGKRKFMLKIREECSKRETVLAIKPSLWESVRGFAA